MRALAFGEILWDIINGDPHLGGAPLNFAAHISQCGAKSFIISRLGNDNLGRMALERVKEKGVDTSLIQMDDTHETGTVKITLTNGQPDYFIRENVAYDFIEYTPALQEIRQAKYDLFYFGSLVQRNEVSAQTLRTILEHHSFKDIFYDVNLRKGGYTLEIIQWSIGHCTILKLNTDEVPVLSQLLFQKNISREEFCKRINEQYQVRIIIITASADGCFIYTNQHLSHIGGVKVEVADAVGAGDAFSAAFMFHFMKTKNAIEAASIGNRIGAYVASKKGAIPKYSPEIRSLLKQKRNKTA